MDRDRPSGNVYLKVLKKDSFKQFIMHYFQMYSLVARQSYALCSIPLNISGTPTGITYSYHNIINYISYALLTSL